MGDAAALLEILITAAGQERGDLRGDLQLSYRPHADIHIYIILIYIYIYTYNIETIYIDIFFCVVFFLTSSSFFSYSWWRNPPLSLPFRLDPSLCWLLNIHPQSFSSCLACSRYRPLYATSTENSFYWFCSVCVWVCVCVNIWFGLSIICAGEYSAHNNHVTCCKSNTTLPTKRVVANQRITILCYLKQKCLQLLTT